MRVSKRGQITTTRELRERAGLQPGTEVDVAFDGHALTVTRVVNMPKSRNGRAIVAHLRGRGDVAMTTDEIMKLMRG